MPHPGQGWRPEGDANLRAIVAEVSVGDFDLLLPADAESEVTARLALPRVEALKVAHHGSEDSGLAALLERARPRLALISVGAGNPYGHPTAATLATLAAHGVRTLRTDLDGSISLEVDRGAIAVATGG